MAPLRDAYGRGDMQTFWRANVRLGSYAAWRGRIGSKNSRAGTSAPTLAAAWSGPVELFGALDEQPHLKGGVIEKIVVEAQSTFDSLPGGRRNHDLVVHCRLPEGQRLVVCIEAKADEAFGQTVWQCRKAVERKLRKGEKTNAGDRLDGLLARLVPLDPSDERVLALRYQLLTALAGTLAEARKAGAGYAVLMVHEFATDQRAGKRLAEHEAQLRQFMTTVFGSAPPISKQPPWCVRVQAPNTPGLELYVARAVTDLRKATLEQHAYQEHPVVAA